MRVIILKSFVSRIGDKIYRMGMNDVVDMPDGADWVRVGFAEPVDGPAPESAAAEPAETAAKKAPSKRRKKVSNK